MPPLPPRAPDPQSVKVQLTTGTGVDIAWKDGHSSHYSFQYLRDACPCALCDEERHKENRQPGEAPHSKPGELPMFRATTRPVQAEPVGRYALRFTWNDGHEHGIYSWDYLRDICPCPECRARRAAREGVAASDVKQ